MSIPVPSIGRVVHFVRPGSADGKHKPAHAAAIITAVPGGKGFEDIGISLCVLNPNGLYFNENVKHDEDQGPSTWHWPEYVPGRD